MPKIYPFHWFDKQAEEAVSLYCSIFPNSKIGKIAPYGQSGPGPEGSVMTISFTLDGQEFTALNAGPRFKFTEAISFVVSCKAQQEIDHYWSKLTADGGQESMCGWLKDKFARATSAVTAIAQHKSAILIVPRRPHPMPVSSGMWRPLFPGMTIHV